MKNNNKSSYVYVFLYKYHCVFCVMILIISFLIMVVVVVVSIHVLSLATESIFLALVKYYYVEGEYTNWIYISSSPTMNNCHLKFSGRNSYKWWQKKTSIKFIIVSIMLLIWFMIVVELGYSIFANIDEKNLTEVCIYLQEKQL